NSEASTTTATATNVRAVPATLIEPNLPIRLKSSDESLGTSRQFRQLTRFEPIRYTPIRATTRPCSVKAGKNHLVGPGHHDEPTRARPPTRYRLCRIPTGHEAHCE